jgi:Uma2 family endonuclease
MSSIFHNVTIFNNVGTLSRVLLCEKLRKAKYMLSFKKYALENQDGELLRKPNGKIKYFSANELLLYTTNSDNDAEITMKDALKFNGVTEENSNDAQY